MVECGLQGQVNFEFKGEKFGLQLEFQDVQEYTEKTHKKTKKKKQTNRPLPPKNFPYLFPVLCKLLIIHHHLPLSLHLLIKWMNYKVVRN